MHSSHSAATAEVPHSRRDLGSARFTNCENTIACNLTWIRPRQNHHPRLAAGSKPLAAAASLGSAASTRRAGTLACARTSLHESVRAFCERKTEYAASDC